MSKISQKTKEFYNNSLIWDAHAGFELTKEQDMESLSIWKDAGVNYLSVNVGYDVRDWRTTIKNLSIARRWIDNRSDVSLVDNVSDINEAIEKKNLAVTFDIEGMCALDNSIEMVQLYYDLGVRQMLFAYNLNNAAGGGCHDKDIGLTDFGKSIIEEMNKVGMLIDCSHSSYTTTMEAIDLSNGPVIFSHSNARAVTDHERNIWDDQAKACAAKGGVIGVNGVGVFLGQDDISSLNMAKHILYYVNLIGAAHVGIGIDYELNNVISEDENFETFDATLAENPNFWPPKQYPGGALKCVEPSQIPEIVEILISEGLKACEIEGILGKNFQRVAENIWK